MMRLFSKIWLSLFGWKVIVSKEVLDLKKAIYVVAPHTSSSDFFLGLLIRSAYRIKVGFLGKQSLFKPPFGFLIRWAGGHPVDRSGNNNLVDTVKEMFLSHDEFHIALAPEGTRQRVDEFRTGFYYIAKGANVPLILVRFNYGERIVHFSDPFPITNNSERDIEDIQDHFRGIIGKSKQNSFF